MIIQLSNHTQVLIDKKYLPYFPRLEPFSVKVITEHNNQSMKGGTINK